MAFKKLLYPEFFQGKHNKDRYFEGWYYKLVSGDEQDTLALIPGISMNKLDPHAFIQVFISHRDSEGVSLKTHYIKYDIKQFAYGEDVFWIQIGENHFSKDHVDLSIQTSDININGEIDLSELTPIKKSVLVPNIMGFFGYFNFMECYHGIISMTHNTKGKLMINQKTIDFNQGRGYIEKDWGKSFPRAYVWLQSNHFKDYKTSLIFSYADIPFLGMYFKGLIVNLIYDGKEYRFATYNGAKVKEELIEPNHAHYVIKRGKYVLEVDAYSDHEIGLASPREGQMIEQIKEGLSGSIKIKLFKNKELIYADEGLHAGIEIMKHKK